MKKQKLNLKKTTIISLNPENIMGGSATVFTNCYCDWTKNTECGTYACPTISGCFPQPAPQTHGGCSLSVICGNTLVTCPISKL